MPHFAITNLTNVPLHIALSHLGPVHYYNNLQPNQTVTLSVGQVWFTIEAKVASGENEYKWHHVAVPIVAATVVGVASAAAIGVVATAVSAEAAIATFLAAGARAGTYATTLTQKKPIQYASKKLKVVGKEHIKDFKKSWVAKKCCKRYGVYVPKEGIEARIVGGPQAVYPTADGTQVIDADVTMVNFNILIKDTAASAAVRPPLPPRPLTVPRMSNSGDKISVKSM
ncbi:hypothetical protein K450DRAFT_278312 [Umbelopsis ramanniana AG]|uniref:Uncharacterized protein n=1 Tax=Umbelopsis ramanniana AG TaxID=1314678 RepID=A0AAD5EE72_UMBRA|nr:uncharacterized protein K450DRAFT_278312 [Umbelopsis ramanniana AG]KAI8582253.1 hypothetical protein K450DRAFT_278312 [Umbelopsis ramanniana AG]